MVLRLLFRCPAVGVSVWWGGGWGGWGRYIFGFEGVELDVADVCLEGRVLDDLVEAGDALVRRVEADEGEEGLGGGAVEAVADEAEGAELSTLEGGEDLEDDLLGEADDVESHVVWVEVVKAGCATVKPQLMARRDVVALNTARCSQWATGA